MEILKATFQEFGSTIGNVDIFKGFVSGVTKALEALNGFVSNKFLMTFLGGGLVFKGLLTAGKNLDTITSGIKKLGSAFKIVLPQYSLLTAKSRESAITAYTNAKATKEEAQANFLAAIAAKKKAMEEVNDANSTDLAAKATLRKAIAAEEEARANFTAASSNASSLAGTAGIARLGAAVPILGAITTALTLAIAVWQWYQQSQEEARQAALDAANAFATEKAEMDAQIDSVSTLREELEKAIDSSDDQRTYELKKDIYKIQSDIVDKYGDQAAGIDLVNGKLDEEIGKYKEILSKQAEASISDNPQVKRGYDNAVRYADSTTTLQTDASANMNPNIYIGNERQVVEQVKRMFEDAGIVFTGKDSGSFFIDLEANPLEAEKNNF